MAISKSETKELRYTVSPDQARAALGITPKQQRNWQSAGLFIPEFGKGAKRFTQRDVEHLRFLKRLILEFGIAIPTVKSLYDSYHWKFPDNPRRTFFFLDLRQPRLLDLDDAMGAIMEQISVLPSIDKQIDFINESVATLSVALFTYLARKNRGSGSYKVSRDEIIEKIREMDYVSRISNNSDGDLVLEPKLNDDPEMDQERLEKLRLEQIRRIGS